MVLGEVGKNPVTNLPFSDTFADFLNDTWEIIRSEQLERLREMSFTCTVTAGHKGIGARKGVSSHSNDAISPV
jgi:hypothetical protein